MAVLSPQLAFLLSLNLGYLSGNDLCLYCNPELLIARLNVQPNSLQKGANQGISEVQSALQNLYDFTTELKKSDTLTALALSALTGAAVTGITVTQPGSGFTAAPVVTLINGKGDITGSGATATAVVSASFVSSIYLTSTGRRYTSAPAVSIDGGGGSGATAVAVINSCGRVISITITSPGTNYTSEPVVTITGGGGLGAAAIASVKYGQVTGITVNTPGTLYTVPPTVVIDGTNVQAADTRNPQLVKICSLYAVRNSLGSMQNVSDWTLSLIKEAEQTVMDIKNGTAGLTLLEASKEMRSDAVLVRDQFKFLG